MHGLTGGSISIDLYFCQKFHSLFPGRCLHLDSSEVAKVVLEDENEEARDNIPDQVSQGNGLALLHAQLVILTGPLNSPVFKRVYLSSVQGV